MNDSHLNGIISIAKKICDIGNEKKPGVYVASNALCNILASQTYLYENAWIHEYEYVGPPANKRFRMVGGEFPIDLKGQIGYLPYEINGVPLFVKVVFMGNMNVHKNKGLVRVSSCSFFFVILFLVSNLLPGFIPE